jgi:hypothetical protein
MSDKRSPEEIEKLKENWKKDPCWDIEDTEGFEAHREELSAWRKEYEAKLEAEWEIGFQKRLEHVMECTGVSMADKGILDSLRTWSEIEHSVRRQDRYIGEYLNGAAMIMAELAQEQIRATLLQAAQLKRIADALENMADGERFAETVRIWGGE